MPRAVPAQELLKALPLFEALDLATLARLAAATERRDLRRGEAVFRRGSRPTGLYVLVHGQVRLLGPGRGGARRLTGVVEAGQSFGEPVLFLDRTALVDAEAATDESAPRSGERFALAVAPRRIDHHHPRFACACARRRRRWTPRDAPALPIRRR